MEELEEVKKEINEDTSKEENEYKDCIYCRNKCSGIDIITRKGKDIEIDKPYILMFGEDSPIHNDCLKDAIIGIKYIIEDYPKLKNIVQLMHPGNSKVKNYPWSKLYGDRDEY